jgi:hypothetical protein
MPYKQITRCIVPSQKKIAPSLQGRFQIVKEPNKLVPSIPETTDGKTISLIAVTIACTATVIVQVAVRSIRRR